MKDERREDEGRGCVHRLSEHSGRSSIVHHVAEERGMKRISSVRELDVYKLAFEAAMEIFEVTKTFPGEEKYSMTDQMRRSSRSVCANLSEGWRKRRYKAVFVNKLSDSAQ